MKKYSKQFKDFVKELCNENEGKNIVSNSNMGELERLFTRVTGKTPLKRAYAFKN